MKVILDDDACWNNTDVLGVAGHVCLLVTVCLMLLMLCWVCMVSLEY